MSPAGSTPPACAVCGTSCKPPFRAPSAEYAPDLDGRPGEPARSTLSRWIALCPGCGAAAPDLAALSPDAAAIVRSEIYQAEPDRFLRWSRLAADPAEALLQAAWRREDKNEDATDLRRRAADAWQGNPLRRLDILRRAGEFEAAAALADSMAGLDEDQGRILAFQQDRIAAADASRYAISSALRPPARTPHVTHGQKPASQPGTVSGLLARLFGR